MCVTLLLACVSLVVWCAGGGDGGGASASPSRRVHGGKPVTSLRGAGYAGLLLLMCRYPAEMRSWSCGASVLKPRLILTAVHCLNTCHDIASTHVFIGDLVAFAGKAYEVQRFIGHARYSAKHPFAYDIALGLTTIAIPMGEYVQAATVSKHYTAFTSAHVFGWGVKSIHGESKYVMSELQVPYISTKRCNYIFKTTIPDGTFCAGSDTRNYVTFGDSGCGLVVDGGGPPRLMGLVTGGYPYTRLAPALYTNVTLHYSWLQAVAAAFQQRL